MSRSRGAVLLLALWAVALLSAAAVALGVRIALQLKLARRFQESRQSWYLAWAASEIAGRELASDNELAWDAPKERWGAVLPDGSPFSAGWLRYRIQDEQARIPINCAPVEIIARLPGFSLLAADELIARRNDGKPVAHLGELLALPGFRKEGLPELAGMATVYGSGAVNINTAPAPVLTHLGLSPSLSDRIAAFRLGPDGEWGTRDDGVFPDVERIIPLLEEGSGPLLPEDQTALGNLIASQRIGVRSSFFQVEAEGWIQTDGIHSKVSAVLERAGSSGPLVLRGWSEN